MRWAGPRLMLRPHLWGLRGSAEVSRGIIDDHRLTTVPRKLPIASDFVNASLSFAKWYGCPTLPARGFKREPAAAAVDLQTMGRDIIRNLSCKRMILKSTTPTRAGKGMLLELDLEQQPTMENGHSAWHGTRVTNLKSIFAEGMRQGPAVPAGIYSFKDALKHKCFTRHYCTAVRCSPGVFIKVVLHLSASGLWGVHPPRTIRKDQWISKTAVVVGLEAEIFLAEALEAGEMVLDLDHMLGQMEERD